MMNTKVIFIMVLLGVSIPVFSVAPEVPEIATIQTDKVTGFSNGGWNCDRYVDLKPLDAHAKITIADIRGPAVIRHIHTTRHYPEEIMSRGIVLEIWFDDANQPAVFCPLADFFGDGCNGQSMHFTSTLIECAPWSYNSYIVMPFKSRARVILRNDTDQNTTNYSYVEWENLDEWKPEYGYFHATYSRRCFQLTKDTKETFFEIEGTGHVLGRQFSIVTDEPLFNDFACVMEGNNEIDIDGRPRVVDYLGTEDSFTFSWGFQDPFAGLHAGMPYIAREVTDCVSLYRFHDVIPIRFTKSLAWHINWRHERGFTQKPEWPKAVNAGGCWVDYAAVYYWYQTIPGGYKHQPLRPVSERQKRCLRSSVDSERTTGSK